MVELQQGPASIPLRLELGVLVYVTNLWRKDQ
jgi:hypothetical protein